MDLTMDEALDTEDMDLPKLWSVITLEMSQASREAGRLRDLGYVAWTRSMDMVDGKLQIVDKGLFDKSRELFAKAREVETML